MYDRILDLRIATPQIVINYALFLEEHKYFEESFKVGGESQCWGEVWGGRRGWLPEVKGLMGAGLGGSLGAGIAWFTLCLGGLGEAE